MTYDALNARLSVVPSSVSDINRNMTKKIYNSTFSHSPSYFEVAINNSPSPTGVQIVDDSNVRDQKLITCLDYLLKNGDIIHWQDSQWINILTDNMSDIYYRGTLRRCVGQLKWVDNEGIVRSTHFTFKSDPATNFGVQDGRIFTVGNERRNLIVPVDEHTAKFKKAMRFIFDNRVWNVTAIDTISVSGLSIITVDEGLIDAAKDNMEFEIADYYGRVASYTLTILNEDRFSINAGKTLQLNVEVRNNGVVVSRHLSFSSSDESIATVDSNGLITTRANGSVVITTALVEDPSVTDSIAGTVEFATHNNYTVELLESPIVYVNKTKTFTVQVKNNGVIDRNKFVNWYLYDEDKVNTTTNIATLVSSSTTQATLKGLDAGFVWFKIDLIGYYLTFWIKVEVKSLI